MLTFNESINHRQEAQLIDKMKFERLKARGSFLKNSPGYRIALKSKNVFFLEKGEYLD